MFVIQTGSLDEEEKTGYICRWMGSLNEEE